MALDTSGMTILCTSDGYYRYVCHERRILTTGFQTREGLERNADILADHATALEHMRERYTQTFMGKQDSGKG